MKRISSLLLVLAILIGFNMPVYAMSNEQTVTIQSFLDDVRRDSRVPGISVAIVDGNETYFFSSGLANREMEIAADEKTLWELASVSKAYTALAVLLLEEQGLLSLSDSIADYLPWFTLQYMGQPIDMKNVKLYHLLHHTTGITNGMHPNLVLDRTEPDTLRNTVEARNNAQIAFYLGEIMEYGTINYDILGLVIESVSGQSYESFMEEKIFMPLGLTQTFAYRDNAIETGQLAQGYATQFIFGTVMRDSPEARGSVPAGYIISSTADMARWMDIQLGIVDDIPEIFDVIIPRSHLPGQSVAEEDGTYYAAGWYVNIEQGKIAHTGGNPGFSSNVMLFPGKQIGITMLSNSPGNWDIPFRIKDILDGNSSQSIPVNIIFLLDIIFTVVTIIGVLLATLFIFLAFRKKKKIPLSGKRIGLITAWATLTVVACITLCLFIGTTFGINWSFILCWNPFSILIGSIALTMLCASITLFLISSVARINK